MECTLGSDGSKAKSSGQRLSVSGEAGPLATRLCPEHAWAAASSVLDIQLLLLEERIRARAAKVRAELPDATGVESSLSATAAAATGASAATTEVKKLAKLASSLRLRRESRGEADSDELEQSARADRPAGDALAIDTARCVQPCCWG